MQEWLHKTKEKLTTLLIKNIKKYMMLLQEGLFLKPSVAGGANIGPGELALAMLGNLVQKLKKVILISMVQYTNPKLVLVV